MARLVDLLQQIAQGGTAGGTGSPGSGAFFERGQVAKVYEDGKLGVKVKWRTIVGTVVAKPVTDEVFRDGDLVWISQAGSEFIVHGGVR